MNNQSPLVPPGSPLDPKNKSRTRVEIAVFVVLAIHGIGLLALLMQGCQKPPESTTMDAATNATPAFVTPTNPPTPPPTNPVAVAPTPTNTVVTPPPAEPVTAPPAAPAGATEYTIAQGDTFSALAKKFGLKVKAIENANPGVDPAKLKIGQKIQIPAPPAAPTPGATATAAPDATATTGGEQAYAVKSGDTLGGIAKANGVTVKALRAANDLKTDRITVGQKLKIPARTAPAAPDASAAGSTGTTSAPPSR